jgi:hypothetical protein
MWPPWLARLLRRSPPRGPAPRVDPASLFAARVPLPLRDDVIAASYGPGFQTDLSSWTLWLDRAGGLRQQVRVCAPENDYRVEHRTETAQVAADEVAALLRLAEEVGFQDLPPALGEWNLTDQGTIAVTVRLPGGVAAVFAYGASLAAYRGMPEAVRLVRLWERVERLSLYRSRYRSRA